MNFLIFFEEHGIIREFSTARTPQKNGVVERMSRTFKNALFKRVERRRSQAPGADDVQWADFVEPIMQQCNSAVHSSTGKTPIDARKSSNEMDVELSLEMKAKRGRKYPELQVGDTVKILRNKKLGRKRMSPLFRSGRFNIDAITKNFGQTFYIIKGVEYKRADQAKVSN